ncbi:MAG: hypothetical protein M1564_03860 [Candidatus Marsarchaeota archaeon]|nr:hypothetical protein [Candidatus Marsarchaeota archaeon]MCL5431401.1 hypothetical protein [Candidatus Marsarchaeota archaeon]
MVRKSLAAAYLIAAIVIIAVYLYSNSQLGTPQPKITYSFNRSVQTISGSINDTLGYPIEFGEFFCVLPGGHKGLFPITSNNSTHNITLNSSGTFNFILTADQNMTSNCTSVGVYYKKV